MKLDSKIPLKEITDISRIIGRTVILSENGISGYSLNYILRVDEVVESADGKSFRIRQSGGIKQVCATSETFVLFRE